MAEWKYFLAFEIIIELVKKSIILLNKLNAIVRQNSCGCLMYVKMCLSFLLLPASVLKL